MSLSFLDYLPNLATKAHEKPATLPADLFVPEAEEKAHLDRIPGILRLMRDHELRLQQIWASDGTRTDAFVALNDVSSYLARFRPRGAFLSLETFVLNDGKGLARRDPAGRNLVERFGFTEADRVESLASAVS